MTTAARLRASAATVGLLSLLVAVIGALTLVYATNKLSTIDK